MDDVIARGFQMRLRLLLWSLAGLPLAAACLVLAILTITGIPLIAVWVGIPLLFATILATRPIANVYRRAAANLLGVGVARPYLRPPKGNLLVRVRRLALDPATVRDAVWVLINGTAGLVLAIVSVLESLLDLLFWWLPPAVLMRVNAYLALGLLQPSQKSLLALRVQELTDSRAATVDHQAAELRRIERDLHDGAQARIVSLGMSLGMAEELLERDPAAARRLLAEAREASGTALEELRSLVRGIHPPVLADRGVAGAVQALALAAPFPVEVELSMPVRLPPPAESAAYFAVAEALTNVIKHAHATHAEISIRFEHDLLHMQVKDDGAGGADPARGTGLRGIERRLSAFDGRLDVSSPIGGPTVLSMELPCESSSPKILPSSGTA